MGPDCFEIDVDGKVVFVKREGAGSIFIRKSTLESFLRAARRRRRPVAVYGDLETFEA
eukprot:CAMPEP_0172584202 /NCGR_PEP_ID=MMETSP1068-20121228/3780_1 /TAXON_ID=35684 /ORGANISM="Pseudopedinella elastica, Strain CCMP716" /LENGTH=57 /DNA_ID=CAMNT_0013378295 /DNA_START=500 /DNA_END=673 /DNA_ORIENTATION=-